MSKLILSLVGYGGSGKTSAAIFLQEKYGFAPFAFSSVIREYASANGIVLQNRTDYAKTHAAMIARYGWDYTLNIGLGIRSERICIDDVRSKKYAERIQRAGGISIAFDCPTEIRFEHVRNHHDRAKYPDSLAAFIQNERADEAALIGVGLQFETAALIDSADYHIDGSGTLESTLGQINAIVGSLLQSGHATP
jgi:dephospho-CoA kinase